MRRQEDCRYITASIIAAETGDAALALLLGLLCGAYEKCPDAAFWDVCIEFLRKRDQGLRSLIIRR